MVARAVWALLLLAAAAAPLSAAPPDTPATDAKPDAPGIAPCRLLTVKARSGEETFLACPKASLRLDPSKRYELAWNPALQQMAVIGHGANEDKALLISDGAADQPIVEDLTVELVKTARTAASDRSIEAVRITDIGQFAGAGGLKIGETKAASLGRTPREWPVSIRATGTEDSPRVTVVH